MSNFSKRAALALVAATCLIATSAAAQSAIDGVWKVTNAVSTGANPTTNASPRANLYIFARGHYANVSDNGRADRTAVTLTDPANPTDAEKLAKYQEWSPIGAQAGTYTVKGSTLIRHPRVAKNVGAMTPPDYSAEFNLTGNTLVLVSQAAPGQPARETTLTLTRVK